MVEVEGLEEAEVDYPEPVRKSLGAIGTELLVCEGTLCFVVRGRAAPDANSLRGAIRYQPCVGGACLPPRELAWEATLQQ